MDPKRRNLITTLVAGAAAVAYVFVIFLPQQKTVSQVNDQASQQEQYLKTAADLDLRLAQARQRLTDVRATNASWREHAPRADQLGATLGAIVDEATAAEVKVVSFDPQTALPGAAVSRVPVTIHLAGTLPQLFEFVRRLEKLPQSSWIDELRFHTGEEAGETVKAEISFAIFVDNQKNSG